MASLEDTRDIIAEHLEGIKTLFKPGIKVTLLVRTETHPDGSRDLVMTDDDLETAIAALRIRQEAEMAL